MQQNERKSFTDSLTFAERVSKRTLSPQLLLIVEEIDDRVARIATKLEASAHISGPFVLKGIREAESFIQNICSQEDLELLSRLGKQEIHKINEELNKKTGDLSAAELAVNKYAFMNTAELHFNRVCAYWHDVWVNNHHIYEAANNGEYPLIDADGNKMVITKIAPTSFTSGDGKLYSSDQVKPYINPFISKKKRGELYGGLSCERVPEQKEDQQNAGESSLVGEKRVILNRSCNGCIGVYPGQWLRIGTPVDPIKNGELYAEIPGDWVADGFKLEKKAFLYFDMQVNKYALYQKGSKKDDTLFLCDPDKNGKLQNVSEELLPVGPVIDDTYLLQINNPDTEKPEFHVYGKGITAMMNTTFENDEFQLPYKQKKGGYNVDNARFEITFEDTTTSSLPTFWGKGAAGDELRWDYDFSPNVIQQKFRRGQPYPAPLLIAPGIMAIRKKKQPVIADSGVIGQGGSPHPDDQVEKIQGTIAADTQSAHGKGPLGTGNLDFYNATPRASIERRLQEAQEARNPQPSTVSASASGTNVASTAQLTQAQQRGRVGRLFGKVSSVLLHPQQTYRHRRALHNLPFPAQTTRLEDPNKQSPDASTPHGKVHHAAAPNRNAGNQGR